MAGPNGYLIRATAGTLERLGKSLQQEPGIDAVFVFSNAILVRSDMDTLFVAYTTETEGEVSAIRKLIGTRALEMLGPELVDIKEELK